MIFIGNQTSCWTTTPFQPFEFALSQGFNAFEWFPDKTPTAGWDDSDLDSMKRQDLKAAAQARAMRLSVHARWQANALEPQGREWLTRDLALASDLGAVLLNIHLFEGQGITAFIEAVMPLIQETARRKMLLSIENTPHHSPELFNKLFETLRDLPWGNTGHVGMCLDIGHANLAAATRNDYVGFLDRLKPTVPIIHLHAHENWGDTDSHLPLFTGPAAQDDAGIRALLDRLKARGFEGSIILEQWPNPVSLLVDARNRLLTLWGSDQAVSTGQPTAREPVRPVSEPVRSGAEFTQKLVAGNRQARSWREKLEVIAEVFRNHPNSLTLEQLVEVAVYLRFLATGEIECVEDGRHFRPAHHARLASDIFHRLAGMATEKNRFVLRRIYPALPSFDASFRQAEPLTRIRDIAHRNDIGSELKQEIKTTLQNKLHRCAGPEDLATSGALLKRITAPGGHYPQEFIEQFKIFHTELSEFFNAASLEQRLELLAKSTRPLKPWIETFLAEKRANEPNGRLRALKALTDLRHEIDKIGTSGFSSETQALILADISLEGYAFTLLSQITNDCEASSDPSALTSRGKALVWGLENLALSGCDAVESLALKSELTCWGELSADMPRCEVLRYRASLLRIRRLADNFGAQVIALFSERSEKLGALLGVHPAAVKVFCESEIRSHVVFQISKLADALLNYTRTLLRLAPWNTVVPGTARGTVVLLAGLTQNLNQFSTPTIALVRRAEGDEEIPRNVVAIALSHEIPHLAHLSVRARQAGVVFVACEQGDEFEQIVKLQGNSVSLSATIDGATWETQHTPRAISRKPNSLVTAPVRVRVETYQGWRSIEEADSENAGAKSAGVRRLAELAAKHWEAFSIPRGLVIPFGVMENALAAAHQVASEYSELTRHAETLEGPDRATVLHRLSELVYQLELPQGLQRHVQQFFGNERALVVRSSANCEDLEHLAGAGLYESVVNVTPAQIKSAVLTVWASLWSERATASRVAAGIPHRDAHVAVLIQELVNPEFSFVIHTVNPVSLRPNELYAEIVVGLGETLVSAKDAGSPYRLSCDKTTGVVKILGFANFSQARRPEAQGGVLRETLDYSQIELSRKPGELEELGRRLAKVGSLVEQTFGAPQDIEGAVAKGQIFLVQSRAQQGLSTAQTE